MSQTTITKIHAREILDSRGNPTVACRVTLGDGTTFEASVPSGASTGMFEAYEKRDGDPSRYQGKGVLGAVRAVNEQIAPMLCGVDATHQEEIDRMMISLDGTKNKSNLGANAILSVSLAVAHTAALSQRKPLYAYLQSMMGEGNTLSLPVPMMNILNGGAHASNSIDIQEFMIVPHGFAQFSEALRAGAEVYAQLKQLLKSRGLSTGVGDEGGFAPDFARVEDVLDVICLAIEKAGYTTSQIGLALDVAASEWVENGAYHLPKSKEQFSAEEWIKTLKAWCKTYPILSIEDPLGEEDYAGWQSVTREMGQDVMLVGDDLYVTNLERLGRGITEKCGNSILIKPNQIGTLTEVLEVIRLARSHQMPYILSHRSGETEDSTIADIATATSAPYIKTGAPCRTDRVAKYNRLLAIEDELGGSVRFGR